MKKLLQALLVVLVLGAGVGVSAYFIKTRKPPQPVPQRRLPPLVRMQPAQPQTVRLSVASQGVVSPRTEITLAAEASGRIVAVSPSLAAGGFFEVDEVLVQVDPKDYELAVVRAEANVEAAKARLVREEAEAEVAQQEWRELHRDAPPPPLLARVPQLAEARAALSAAHAAVEEARRELAKTRVLAPFPGRVLSKSADLGQYVTRGAALARLQAIDYAEVRLPIPLDQLAHVDLPVDYRGEAPAGGGPQVILRARLAGQEHSWPARITRTESQIDPQTRMIIAVAKVDDPYRRKSASPGRPPLPAGLFVQAEIQGRTVEQVYEIPRSALRAQDQVLLIKPLPPDPAATNGPLGVLEIRAVPVVRAQRETVLVRGLQPGEWLCLSSLEAPVAGMTVRFAPPPDRHP